MLKLHRFPMPFQDASPLDFATDPATKKRKGNTTEPNGVVKHNLHPGVNGCVLPPLATWAAGKYIDELKAEARKSFLPYVAPHDEHDAYIVTGEFTPGNFIARIYILPKSISGTQNPKHPLEWNEWLQKGEAVTSYSGVGTGAWNGGRGATGPPPPLKPATPFPPKARPVPARVRYRCDGCGHWFKEDDLGPHAEFCCPGLKGDDSDWAIMCECCETLDAVSTRKPGFPRPIKKVAKKEPKPAATVVEGEPGEEEKKDGDDEPAAPGEGEGTPSTEPEEAVEGAE